jgi:NAD(P)-dependent dehydrogenase (short-subunit alcohol dehydrogenase family)
MNAYLETLFSLHGKVALVTGASRGIGAALAEALAAAGADTVGLGRSEQPDNVCPAGLEYRRCDVVDADAFSRLCADVFARKGRLDVLINAAGISLPKAEGEAALRDFERTVATNLTAVHHCCKSAAAYMKRSGGGSIVNITSIGSTLGFPGNPAYVASKGGLRMLTRALALDLAPDLIRVNNLAPGYIRTDMTEASFQDPGRHAERLQRMMIQRWGDPQDLAGAAIFLASRASSYVTGTDVFVDGSWTAKGL